jgi:hypothetical protein
MWIQLDSSSIGATAMNDEGQFSDQGHFQFQAEAKELHQTQEFASGGCQLQQQQIPAVSKHKLCNIGSAHFSPAPGSANSHFPVPHSSSSWARHPPPSLPPPLPPTSTLAFAQSAIKQPRFRLRPPFPSLPCHCHACLPWTSTSSIPLIWIALAKGRNSK